MNVVGTLFYSQMRQSELSGGVPLMDKDGNKVGESSVTAARWGISQVIQNTYNTLETYLANALVIFSIAVFSARWQHINIYKSRCRKLESFRLHLLHKEGINKKAKHVDHLL